MRKGLSVNHVVVSLIVTAIAVALALLVLGEQTTQIINQILAGSIQ